jgi:hypothetical protein
MVAVPSADQDQPLTDPDSPYVVASVTLQHRWADRSPRVLYGKSLRVHYRLRSDGCVTRQLVGIDDVAGSPIPSPRRTFPGLNWAEEQERGGRQGQGRPVVLQVAPDEEPADVLRSWLEDVGLLSGDD